MTVRCAIYTRKAAEEGTELTLEQQFNSLNNQRLAGEQYVMEHGYELINNRYDDNGFSGEDMDRPGLQKLFRDIEAGLIDCVIVYKVDRLTEYLPDFEKIIEIFDKYNINLITVCESFNTSTPMGHALLNSFLRFSQYERDLAGESVRHKIAKAKQSEYWLS